MSDRSGKIDTGVLAGVCVGLAIVIGFAAFVLLDTTGRDGSGLGKEFVYDVSELGKVDEELILYNESSVFETGFEVSRAIAIDAEETLYVVGDEAIRIFNNSGVFDREISLDDGAPTAIEAIQFIQLRQADRRGQIVHVVFIAQLADFVVPVPLIRLGIGIAAHTFPGVLVDADPAARGDLTDKFGIIGDQHSAIPSGHAFLFFE